MKPNELEAIISASGDLEFICKKYKEIECSFCPLYNLDETCAYNMLIRIIKGSEDRNQQTLTLEY